jgi:hypothetical protein
LFTFYFPLAMQSKVPSLEHELSPAARELAQSFRRRLGRLDPQQVAIWRQMTSGRKGALIFQMWHLARTVVWNTEHQWNPNLTDEELSWRMWKRLHGSKQPYDPAADSQ